MAQGKGKRRGRRPQSNRPASVAERAPGRPIRHDQPWYAREGERGQQLLEQGRIVEATEVFEVMLTRLGGTPSYGRAVVLGRLGRCLHLSGQPVPALSRFREAMELTQELAPSPGVRALGGVVQCEAGDALRALGRNDEARSAYLGALGTAEALRDVRAQVVDLGQLGSLEMSEGQLDEALRRYRSALRLLYPLDDPNLEAATRSQLAAIHHRSEQWEEAERQYRRAIELDRRIGDAGRLVRNLGGLAEVLAGRPRGLGEARALAEEALALAQAQDATGASVWRLYGLLARIAEREEAAMPVDGSRTAPQGRACDYRELERRAPLITRALASLPDGPSQGRAVLLGQLGRCLTIGGRPDLGLQLLDVGLESLEHVAPSETVTGLRGTLLTERGNSLRAMGRRAEAEHAYQASLEAGEELGDLRGQATGLAELAALAIAEDRREDARDRSRAASRLLSELDDPELEAAARSHLEQLSEPERRPDEGEPLDADGEVTVREDVAIDYGFEPDLLVDGRRLSRVVRRAAEPTPLAGDLRPVVMPGARTWMDDDGAVRFALPAGEPTAEPDPGCVILRRTRRDVAVTGRTRLVWRLVRASDGTATVAEILGALPGPDRQTAGRILAGLAEAGALDVSGRATGRYLHAATKKGVLPAGGLGGEEVLDLAADMAYHRYPDGARVPLRELVPERIHALHALTRERRSRREYTDLAIARDQLEALLHTACGVTGAIDLAGRQLELRAYPSSGALYAVEIYPVAFRVDGLEPAVYHYRANEHALESVRPGVDQRSFVDASLPMERRMVAAAAAMVCLTAFFSRHERKYGEGGYRMLIAEAGHISQNLILAATALGLSARPFGGVFDHLLNRALGVDGDQEAFLLAVLVGHAQAAGGTSEPPTR